jgi:hypothetical protein
LGYDFSVVNHREKPEVRPPGESFYAIDSKYGHTLSYFLKKYEIPSHDPRFTEFL